MIGELISLKKKIESLANHQHIEILKILEKRGISYSENNNGIFFNLSVLSQEDIGEINKFLNYISDQEVSLNTLENVKEDFKKTFFHTSNSNPNSNLNSIKDNALEISIQSETHISNAT